MRQHVLAPLRQWGCVDVFLVVTLTGAVGRTFTGESGSVLGGALGWEAAAAFAPCRHEVIDQEAARLGGRVPAPYGPDTWNDEHASVRNHLLELYSARELSMLIRAHEGTGGFQFTHAAVARIDTLVSSHIDFIQISRELWLHGSRLEISTACDLSE